MQHHLPDLARHRAACLDIGILLPRPAWMIGFQGNRRAATLRRTQMLYSDVYVDEPLDKIIDDWDFMSEKVLRKFIGFRPVGDNIYGIRAISHDSTEGLGEKGKGSSDAVKTRKNLEIGPRGIVEVARNPFNVHVTLAGTPHHTQYLFGYWHINDKDEIIVPLPPTENAQRVYPRIVAGSSGR